MRLLVAAEHLGRAGGMERYLETVLPALAARGATVQVVARAIDDALPPHLDAVAIPWADEHDPPDAGARRELERVLQRFRPDAVLAVNVMDAGIVEALRAAPRLVYQVHDHRPLCPNGDRVFPRTGQNCTAPLGFACAVHALADGCGYGPRGATFGLIARRKRLRDALAAADTIMVASAYVGARARACGVPAERIIELPPPLPDDAFVAKPAVAQAPPAILFAGRMVPQKGLDALLSAVALLPGAARPVVDAFGDGPGRFASAERASALGVRLVMHGASTPEAVRAGMDRSTFVVVPSQWAEPFGMVGIEAFARGRTVAAYDAGGIPAWLRDGRNGRAVRPQTGRSGIDALGRVLGELLADEAQRTRLAAQARSDAERYRIGPIVTALAATLEGAV